MKKELSPNEVVFHFDNNIENGNANIKNIPKVDSAYKKIKRAISIEEDNFNLYIIDSFSKYRLDNFIKYIEEVYKTKASPKDICYITYEDIRKPEPIFLNNGNGIRLKNSVEEIKNKYFNNVIEFYNTSSDDEKDKIIDDVNEKRNLYITELINIAKNEGFDLKATSSGFAFIPLKEGEAMTEKEYDSLSEESKESIVVKAGGLKKKAEIVLQKIKNIETYSIEKLKKIYSEFLYKNMEEEKQDLLLDFIIDDNAYEYLERIFQIIEKKLIDCYSISIEEDHEEINNVLNNIEINVLVDNSKYEHPRVIYEEDPTIINLLGNVEYESHNGGYSTDLSLISPGSLLLANEGCIIIRLNQLIMNSLSYYGLKKALLSKKINLDSYRSYLEILSISGLKGKPIPINVKVILIGDYESYDILYNADEDFKKLFFLRVDIKDYINKNNNINLINQYIINRFKEFEINNITNEAVKEVVRYLCRIADSRNKMNYQVEELDKIIMLVKEKIKEDNKEIIDKDDIISVAYEEEEIEYELMDVYNEGKIILSLEGKKIGTINGLAVIDSGYYKFGKIIRVTCVATKGTGRIFDIQKDSNLSGSIHEKSINIIEGLLSNMIDSYKKLPVDFHVSFEQIYGLIDGDSASVAEMLCILSALSKIEINQNIAVTGSINLLGEVQPIGGVKEKIEGFYNICKSLNINNNYGVLIPKRNLDELILKPEIEKSITEGKFHIYVMDNIIDAIELMMNNDINVLNNKIKLEIEKYKNGS